VFCISELKQRGLKPDFSGSKKREKMAHVLQSHCCLECYEAAITEKGDWILKCSKCGKTCASLKEKYTINPDLLRK
jgi:ribosomal protein L37AE/L43A